MNRYELNDRRLGLFGGFELVAFVCECADETCKRSVLLSPGTFRSRREHGDPILYPGHEALADTPLTAERDERLREAAEAAPDRPVA